MESPDNLKSAVGPLGRFIHHRPAEKKEKNNENKIYS